MRWSCLFLALSGCSFGFGVAVEADAPPSASAPQSACVCPQPVGPCDAQLDAWSQTELLAGQPLPRETEACFERVAEATDRAADELDASLECARGANDKALATAIESRARTLRSLGHAAEVLETRPDEGDDDTCVALAERAKLERSAPLSSKRDCQCEASDPGGAVDE